ncbi:Lrp/AsnC family transcriptional regulator (plasmid) [Rhodococcus globerulus]|uniref:Lrp/AsnC family transcriptional regulator n=1 Tax=Rhodococcus globerulus TaxID=33008 RepID=UPI0039ECEF5E
MAIKIDELDAALLAELAVEPRAGILDLSRRLRVARNTIQARMRRLESTGVVKGYPPSMNLHALGFAVHAFIGVKTDQNKMDAVIDVLRTLPHVLEVNAMTGREDLLVRMAAQSQEELLSVIQKVHSIDGVAHTHTMLALATPIEYRSLPLVEYLAKNQQ